MTSIVFVVTVSPQSSAIPKTVLMTNLQTFTSPAAMCYISHQVFGFGSPKSVMALLFQVVYLVVSFSTSIIGEGRYVFWPLCFVRFFFVLSVRAIERAGPVVNIWWCKSFPILVRVRFPTFAVLQPRLSALLIRISCLAKSDKLVCTSELGMVFAVWLADAF